MWPWLVRLTHWWLATIVMINWINDTGDWHRMLGYMGAGVVAIRVVYGMMSTLPAVQFYWPQPRQLVAHLKSVLHGQPEYHVGHNPLGQLAVYLMWLLVILLAFTGWLSRTDAYWGEDWPVFLHTSLSSLLQALVLIHLAGVMVMSRIQGKNLIRSMILRK